MLRLGARLKLLFAVCVLLLAAAASSRSHYFCKMMGRAMAECCCAAESDPREGDGAKARAPDCCELIQAPAAPVVAHHEATLPGLPTAALVATLSALEYRGPSFRLTVARPSLARAPPALGPPRFISHCALLI